MQNDVRSSREQSALCRLPTELLDQIAEYIMEKNNKNDAQIISSSTKSEARLGLCNLALTSRHLRASAQRSLFQKIVLGDYGKPYYVNYTSLYCLVRTLLDRPDIAARVNSLSLNVNCGDQLNAEVSLTNRKYESPGKQCLDEISIHGQLHEREQTLDRCTKVIRTSGLSPAQKAKWKYDLDQSWSTPICGVILSLLTNLESLFLIAPGNRRIDEDPEPLASLFGCSLHEDRNPIRLQSPRSYEKQLGVSGKPDLRGLQTISGLSHLKSLSLITKPHVTLCGLRHLPNIKSLDLDITDCKTVHSMLVYTPTEYEEFNNIESLRIAAGASTIDSSVTGYLKGLASFLIGLTNLRRLTIHTPSVPCKVSYIKDWAADVFFMGGLSGSTYEKLIQSLSPSYPFLETLELPSEFWALPNNFRQSHGDFRVFEKLKSLVAPRQALLGIKPVKPPCNTWFLFYNRLEQGGEWLDEYSLYEGLETRLTNPKNITHGPFDVLPKSLCHLKMLDVDETTCLWLEPVFRSQRREFPTLNKVELVLADDWGWERQRLSGLVWDMAMGSGIDVAVLWKG